MSNEKLRGRTQRSRENTCTHSLPPTQPWGARGNGRDAHSPARGKAQAGVQGKALTAGCRALIRAIGTLRHAVAQLPQGHAVKAVGTWHVLWRAGPAAVQLVAAISAVLFLVAAPAPWGALAAAARELPGAARWCCAGYPS